MTEPIWIDCEGAGHPSARPRGRYEVCSMCGSLELLDDENNIRPHQRQDVLAMIKRGDFG